MSLSICLAGAVHEASLGGAKLRVKEKLITTDRLIRLRTMDESDTIPKKISSLLYGPVEHIRREINELRRTYRL